LASNSGGQRLAGDWLERDGLPPRTTSAPQQFEESLKHHLAPQTSMSWIYTEKPRWGARPRKPSASPSDYDQAFAARSEIVDGRLLEPNALGPYSVCKSIMDNAHEQTTAWENRIDVASAPLARVGPCSLDVDEAEVVPESGRGLYACFNLSIPRRPIAMEARQPGRRSGAIIVSAQESGVSQPARDRDQVRTEWAERQRTFQKITSSKPRNP